MLEDQIYEEIYHEDPDKLSYVEHLDETLVSILHLEEDEVVKPYEEVISPNDIIDQHIDYFIRVGRHRWDMACIIFDKDPIYDIAGSSRMNAELSPSVKWYSYWADSSI